MKTKFLRKPLSIIVSIIAIVAGLGWFAFHNLNTKQDDESEESANKLQFIEAQWQQEFDRTKDPETGTVPKDRLFNALEYKAELVAARNNAGGANRGISGISWQERGPTNIGGRTRALMFDLNDATHKAVFAGAIGGGLWRCNDITLSTPSWIKVSDTYENIGISSIVSSNSKPKTMYYGTGEGWFNLGAQNGLGIWKSTDGGNTWNHLPATMNLDFTTVQKMIVSEGSDSAVYACTSAGVMKSTDGGTTWRNVLKGKAADIEISGTGDIYASLGIFSPGSVWKSLIGSNVGEAGSWINITPSSATGFQRITIATAPSNSQTLYILCQGGASNDATDMFSSINGGTTWTACNVNSAVVQDPVPGTDVNFTRGQAWYDLVCVVDPNTATTVYIGGVDVHKSVNAGGSFTALTKWTALGNVSAIPVVHADQHALVFKPFSSDEAVFGNDGGVFYGSNLTLPTYTIPTKDYGYNVTQFYCLAMHPTAGSNYFLAGAQDNGSQLFNGPTGGASATTPASGGDGGFCHIDQLTPANQFTSYVYSSYYRSTNGGTSFSSTISDATHGQFINPTDYDNVSKIFYGDYTVVATRAGGSYSRWDITGTTNVGVPVTNFKGASVTNVYVSPNNLNRVYFGLANGSIVYVDGANTATAPVGTIIRTGIGSISGIAIEKNNESHILATYSNYGVVSVWETLDAGLTWTSIEGNLPDMPVRWIIFNPTNAGQALIATEIGVWSTDNLNGNATEWNPTGNNMPNCRTDMLQVRASDNLIGVATYGRGLFTTTLNNSTVPLINFAKQTSVVSESNPTTLTGCGTYGYKDVPLNLYISQAPAGDATVTISVNPNSTATLGQDYDFFPKTVTFPSGSSLPQTINIRIFNDDNIEPTEYLELGLAVSGTTNAVKGTVNQNFSMQINDDEVAPSGPYTGKIQVGNFDTNLGGSSPLQGSQTDKKMQYLYRASELLASGVKAGQITGFSFAVGTKGSVQPFNGFTIKIGTTQNTELTPGGAFLLDGSYQTIYTAPSGGYSSVAGDNEFLFNTPFNWDGTSNIVLQYCYHNTAATPAPPAALPAGSGDDIVIGQSTSYNSQARAVSTNTTTDNGCAFMTATQATSTTFRPLVKMFQLQPQTVIDSIITTMKYNVGPLETVYFYSSTGSVIAKVVNQSSFNYGCVQLDVDRAGNSSSMFNSSDPKYFLTSKSIYFTPQFDNPSGSLNITMYLTAAEKAGWESATANLLSSASVIKVKGHHIYEVSPTTPYFTNVQQSTGTTGMLGNDYFISGNFTTGFSGVAVGLVDNRVLAIKNKITLYGEFDGFNAILKWVVFAENNLQSTNLQRSYNGADFTDVNNAVNVKTGTYSFVDNPTNNKVYYRIKSVDNTNHVSYSNIILLGRNNKLDINISPNPFNSNITVQLKKQTAQNIVIEVFDMIGKVLYQKKYPNFSGQLLNVDLKNTKMATGTYILNVVLDGAKQTFKVVKY